MDKNKKCAEKRKFRTSRAVLDVVLNSDDDSDETKVSDLIWYLLLRPYYGKSIRVTVKMFYAAFDTLFYCSDADCVLHIATRFVGLV